MRRRRFLRLAADLSAAAAVGACKRQATREQILGEMVRDVATADVAAIVTETRSLESAIGQLVGSPSLEALAGARDSWRRALLAWKQAYCFRNGPLVETNALLHTTFWPARPAAIEAALRSTAEIDNAYIEELGIDAKGLFALEAILFPEDIDEASLLARFAGPERARYRSFVSALARNIGANAANVAGVLGNGSAFAEQFTTAGQGSINRLVGQMVSTVETVATNRLGLVLGLEKSHMLRAREVEGWPSGTSQAMALTLLRGTERLYGGVGSRRLGDLVRPTAPVVDKRLREAFTAAVDAVEKLAAPLEQVVKTNRAALENAAMTTKGLELLLKIELASALGVTITFQGGDGD